MSEDDTCPRFFTLGSTPALIIVCGRLPYNSTAKTVLQ